MSNSHATKCRRLSERAFELTKHLVPRGPAENIRAFIYDHNEWGLGIETLVDTLLEDDIAVSADQKDAISLALSEMGIDRHQSLLRVEG